MTTRTLAFIGALALLAGPALATDSDPASNAGDGTTILEMSVPNLIPFQGLLTDNGGNPITGGVSLDLAIYDAPGGGTLLWSETQGAVAVADGLFDVQLGAVTSVPLRMFNGNPLWLGISVDGEAELPRTPLLTTPFAQLSTNAFNGLEQDFGFSEQVYSTSDVRMQSYYIGDDGITGTQNWTDIAGRVVCSFNGGFTGAGVLTVLVNGGVVGTFDLGAGNRPWTVEVPLTLNDGDRVEVWARASVAGVPFLIRSIDLDTDSGGGASAHNTLDQAYDEGGPGAGRIIIADSGPVAVEGPGGLRVGTSASLSVIEFAGGINNITCFRSMITSARVARSTSSRRLASVTRSSSPTSTARVVS
jgi:hypothetical protein